MNSKQFCCEGNLFAGVDLLSRKVDITPRRREVSSSDSAVAWTWRVLEYTVIPYSFYKIQ